MTLLSRSLCAAANMKVNVSLHALLAAKIGGPAGRQLLLPNDLVTTFDYVQMPSINRRAIVDRLM